MKVSDFTDEQKQYIKENWQNKSTNALAKEIGCTRETLKKVANSLNLEEHPSNIWQEEEIEQLKVLINEKKPVSEIANELNRTVNAIYQKAEKLGIPLNDIWTEEEQELLKEMWGNIKIETISKKLNRNTKAIKHQAVLMNLGSMITNNYNHLTLTDLCEIFKISRDTIKSTWIPRGLVVRKKSLSKKKSYYLVPIKSLFTFLEKNQDIWDIHNLEKNSLGKEPKWLKEKRKQETHIAKKTNRWTNEQKALAKLLIYQGKSTKEIAEKLEKTEAAINSFKQEINARYTSSRYWELREIKYIRENKASLSPKEMAKHLNRSVGAIKVVVNDLSFQVVAYVPHDWSDKENLYLEENYKKIPNYELANTIGVSKEILIEQLKNLGLYKPNKRIWLEEENEKIRKYYKKERAKELAKEFKVDIRTLYKHLIELGIDKNKVDSEDDKIEKRKEWLTLLKNILELKRRKSQLEQESNEDLDFKNRI